MGRDRKDITRAVRRLANERLEHVSGVAPLIGHPVKTVERYIVRGCEAPGGVKVYLDGLHRPGVGWLTSTPAAMRFIRQLFEADELERERKEALVRAGTVEADLSAMVAPQGRAPPAEAVRFPVHRKRTG